MRKIPLRVLTSLVALCMQGAVSAATIRSVPKDRLFEMQTPSTGARGTIVISYDAVERDGEEISLFIDGTNVAAIRPSETAVFHVAPGQRTVVATTEKGFDDDHATNSRTGRVSTGVANAQTMKLRVSTVDGKSIIRQLTPNARRPRAASVYVYDSEDGSWVDVTPPPSNAIRSVRAPTELRLVRPKSWTVRAAYVSGQGVFEFDRMGNVLRMDGKAPDRSIVVAQPFHGEKAAWQGAVVYYPVQGESSISTVELLDSPRGFVQTPSGRVCPITHIAVSYRMQHELAVPILDGNCEKAIKRRIGDGRFWIYPSAIKAEHPTPYWSVQYFSDPISPVKDEHGQCLIYCNGNTGRFANTLPER